jgi:hypothetical protein
VRKSPNTSRRKGLTLSFLRLIASVTELLNVNGVTVTDLDEYRAGKDVVLEGTS